MLPIDEAIPTEKYKNRHRDTRKKILYNHQKFLFKYTVIRMGMGYAVNKVTERNNYMFNINKQRELHYF